MKTRTTISANPVRHLLEDPRVRKVDLLGEQRYCAVDLVRLLIDTEDSNVLWEQVKRSEHFARLKLVEALFGDEWFAMLSLPQVMRLIESLHSPRAVRLQSWLANVGALHVEEEEDPELAVRRMRQSYAAAGRPRPWIDQRLRSMSARQELVREWNRRGIHDSEQYRALTNAMMEAIFGVDVNTFRRNRRVRQNLRDHLTDTELSLISLAEAVATSLHRAHDSRGMEQLIHDVREAGRIANETRKEIDRVTNGVSSGGHQRVA